MSSGSHAVTTLSIVGAAVVLLGALGIASILQAWYERVYDQPPPQNLARQLANRLLWLGGVMGYLTLQDFSFIRLNRAGRRCSGSHLRRHLHPRRSLLLVDSPRPAAGQDYLGQALPRRPRDGCVHDRSRCVFAPPVLTADRVEQLGLRIDWRGDGAVVLPDRARRLHPHGRCGGSHVGRAPFRSRRPIPKNFLLP